MHGLHGLFGMFRIGSVTNGTYGDMSKKISLYDIAIAHNQYNIADH